MKANIKRKKVVTALNYIGLDYLSGLVQRKEIKTFDDDFFEALVKEINKARALHKKSSDEVLNLKNQLNIQKKQNDELQQELYFHQNIQRENRDLKLENEILLSEIDQLKNSVELDPQTRQQLNNQIFLAQQIADMFNVPKE